VPPHHNDLHSHPSQSPWGIPRLESKYTRHALAVAVTIMAVALASIVSSSRDEYVLRTALMWLVLLSAVAVLPLDTPTLLFGAAITIATLAGVLSWYPRVLGLAEVAHAVVPALAAWQLARLLRIRPSPSRSPRFPPSKFVVVIAVAGLVGAAVWEMYEILVQRFVYDHGIVTYGYDTIADLVLGVGGAIFLAVGLESQQWRHLTRQAR
jgi:ABC-type branched-subunit amino acid transport system permease subunit